MEALAGGARPALGLGAGAPALAENIAVDGTTCTLVDAITAANTDTATGGCTAGSGPDTLTLQSGSVHTLTSVNNYSAFYGTNGLPVVISVITIEGNGSTIMRDSGAPEFRIFDVGQSGRLSLNETTVSGGVVYGNGGGVYTRYGTVTLTNSTVSGNSADGGGGVFNGSGTLTSGTVTLTNSTVSGNTSGFGGGVQNFGTLTLTDSTVSGNSAGFYGGGVNNGVSGKATLTLTNSTVSGNSAGFYGGGVENFFGTVTLTNSTVSGNSADRDGGGVFSYGSTADVTLTHSTVSGNSADSGGGVSNAGTLTLTRTLVSGNTGNFSGGEIDSYCFISSCTVITDNFNLFGHSGLSNAQAFSGFTPGASDITATSDGTAPTPLANILNTLADNGGPTQTHALVVGSPAIDAAGPGCPPPATDQRGVARPQGAACDIGAFEVMAAPSTDLSVDKADSPDPVVVTDHLTYTVTVNNAGETDAAGVMLTDTLPTEVDFVSASSSQGSCLEAGGVVDCDLGDLANGDSATVTIVVMPTATGTLTNSVEVTANEPDDNPTNNTDSEETTVTPLLCNGRVPTLVGTPGDDTLTGTSGNDIILGLGGNDRINGRGGSDVLCGGEGDDTLFGRPGNDVILGEGGNDILIGGPNADTLDGGTGTDTCNGGLGTDTGANCETMTRIP